MRQTTISEQIINVIDTPGLFDGINDAGKEIVKCIDMAKDGIHAIILVFTTRTRFSEEEQSTFLTLQALFGPKIIDYMLVLFTGGDSLEFDGITLDNYLSQCPQHLQVLLSLCGDRKILFNNRITEENKRLEQNQQLLKLVDSIIEQNDGQPFTNELFKRLKERATATEKAETLRMKRRLQRRYENELKRMSDMIQSKLVEEMEKLKVMFEEEKAARVNAEKKYESFQISSKQEIQRLKMDLEKANSSLCAIL
ncbi:hypothetical protein VNO80_26237 [Phaseolus coccineus]|uniref:AIG1-type G domain-containing protein n=1 Tax=Phaseolus coccineus TaxID=3886 RepID=A0AAN9LEC9_PHACN